MNGITRRDFAAAASGAVLVGLDPSNASAEIPVPVHYVRASPYEALARHIGPGLDTFPPEKEAAEIEDRLRRILREYVPVICGIFTMQLRQYG